MISSFSNVDIFEFANEPNTYIFNPVNCVGVMGAGLALQFKQRYPDMFNAYQQGCAQGILKPGTPAIYKNIVLFPTKLDWRNPSQYEWIEQGLKRLSHRFKDKRVKFIIPPLGCGLGGLDKRQVMHLIFDAFRYTNIEVILCGFKNNNI